MTKPDMNYDQAMARIAELEKLLGDMRNAAEMLWTVLAGVGIHQGRDWRDEHQEWREAAVQWRDNYFAAERACAPACPAVTP